MAQVAQEAEGMVIETECKAQAMLEDLGWKYRPGVALQSVLDFQRAWNQILPYVRSVDGVVLPDRNKGNLVEDGLYGSQSATAAQNFILVPLPKRAADMPAWYAANQGDVAGMCAPAPPGPEVVPQPMQQGPEPVIPSVIQAEQPEAMVMQPEVIEQPQDALVVVADPERIKDELAQGPVQAVGPDSPSLIPEPEVLPEARIVAQPRRGDVPVIAIAAGLFAVAGVAGYWMYRRKA